MAVVHLDSVTEDSEQKKSVKFLQTPPDVSVFT